MTAFAVGVPARDEEELLPRCLASLDEAAARLRRDVPGSTVRVVVALDSCTDGSLDAVRTTAATLRIDVVAREVTAGSAALARQTACLAALTRVPAGDRVWVSTTDADTTVPENWFTVQHGALSLGHDVFAGTAQPDPADVDPRILEAFHDRHLYETGHPHVHGASLGLSARAFELTGGFSPLEVGEDQDLVDRARALGLRVLATDAARVTTSGRLASRVRGGFADYLAALPL